MATKFQLRVVTPTSEAVNEEVFEVTAPGTMGEFGILPDHAAFLSSLETGCLRYRSDSGEQRIAIRDGFAEVSGNVMTVLSEAAARPDQVDTGEVTAELQQATSQLSDLSIYDDGYQDAAAAVSWAEARLSAAAQ